MFHSSCGLSADLYFFGIKFQCFTLESYFRLLLDIPVDSDHLFRFIASSQIASFAISPICSEW